MNYPLGWLQLRHNPMRLAVAVAGIGFAVLLILMQLGFREALFESAVRWHERFRYDVALFSPNSVFIVRPEPFSIRRLYQAAGVQGVQDVSPVWLAPGVWKNPWNNDRRAITILGVHPEDDLLDTEGYAKNRHLLAESDVLLFDANGRPEFGPVSESFDPAHPLVTELNDRQITVVGLFQMGPSFGIDGNIITSEDNWLRLFPERSRNNIHIGLIRLEPGVDPDEARDRIAALLPDDVRVLTRAGFIQREVDYWQSATPIGYVFSFGAVMGFVVGAIIVYQILFADVSEHIREYATLRAIGYSSRFVSGIVVQQAVILAVLGYLPGLVVVHFLYKAASAATRMPLHHTLGRSVTVLVLTMVMCAVSALLAVRKVRRLDPADVF